MATLLQKTKLFLPTASAPSIDRPRLRARLDSLTSAGARLALVSAPAGSGKTTLVLQWLERLGWPVGWVSLDTRDNTPARFFAYLIAALQPAVPGAGAQAGALLELPGASLSEVVTLLSNDLTAAPGPFLLVLDDFHAITNPIIHQALDDFLDAQPPNMRLVLLTREDPAIQLARRRVRGQLVELRQEDLRFSLAEAQDFLNQVMGLNLSTAQARRLEARTEGWIAGLQLAALSLQSAADPDALIEAFSGSNRFILDYLIEEVLRHQTAEVQDFLLRTSILERFNADLCEALRKVEGPGMPADRAQGSAFLHSSAILDLLSRANLFLIPLDAEGRWFRYHHLFGELLRVRCQALSPDLYRDLHGAASAWYEANADPRLAVEFALKAQDPNRAADLIERHILARWQTVDLEFFLLLNRLPGEMVAARPGLCLQSAWTCVLTGQIERVRPLVETAEAALRAPGRQPDPADGASLAFARTLRAYLADMQNQPVALTPELAQAYAAIPETSTGMRNSAAVIIGTFHYMEGDFAPALAYFTDALERDRRVDGTNAIPIASMRITWVYQAQGRLREAADLLRGQIAYTRDRGSRRYYISGALDLTLGEILLEWNDLDTAETHIRSGLRLMDDWPSPPLRALAHSLLARLDAARGRLEDAQSALAQAEALQQTARFHPKFGQAVDRARVQVWAAAQDWPALEAWLRQREDDLARSAAGQPGGFRFEAGGIERCRAWLALGRPAEAARLLESLAPDASERPGSRLVILALLAAARSAEPLAAAALLETALRLGLSQAAQRVFIEAGEPMRRALDAWLQHGASKNDPALRAYAQALRSACAPVGPAGPSGPPAGMPEPLSRRELEVLGLVADGLTNEQIAGQLFISIRTVKKHIENIHGKLGVQNRTQAAARARQLGLLTG